jgi:hypothetical protein
VFVHIVLYSMTPPPAVQTYNTSTAAWGDLSTDLSADEPTSRETTDSKITVSWRVNNNNTAVFVAVRRLLHVRPYRVHYSRCGLFFTYYIRYFQLPGGDPLLHISRKDILLT